MKSRQSDNSQIANHYGKPELTQDLIETITRAGKSLDGLKPDDLMALDEFHVRGCQATMELAQRAGLDKSMHVLDIGSGIGGPSRFLTLNYGCRVTGVDLTPAYCQMAKFLADKFGLDDRLRYHNVSALDMPFEDNSFDVVWTQHTAMNISNKEMLYAEAARCLKPKGVLAIYDILAGVNQPIHFPVPWAKNQEMSFLATSGEMKTYLENAGMAIHSWQDKSSAGIEWLRTMSEKAAKNSPPLLSINLLLGNDFKIMIGNLLRNLIEDRVVLAEIIAAKTN